VEASLAPAGGEWELILSHASRAEAYRVALEEDPSTGCSRAELTPAAVLSIAGTAPLAEGIWHFALGRRGGLRERAAGAVLDPRLLDSLPFSTEIGRKRFHFGVLDGNAPVLAVERDLAPEERGGFNQSQLWKSWYPAERTRELREAVLYDCFGGREYSDSPRAIHEELLRRGAPYEHLWIVRDSAYEIPHTAIPVRELSRDYYEAYARARYIVSNDHWPRWFVRRPDQISLQTWHGAPLKTNGYELAGRHRAVRAYRRALAERPENWQYLVSPGGFATPVLERAFPLASEVLETGLPRTDFLVGPDRNGLAEEARHRLGVAGKRVVLYAPTYRDQLDYRSGFRLNQLRDLPTYRTDLLNRDGYRLAELLDLGALSRALGEDDVLLFRKHPRVVDVLPSSVQEFVRDVSDFPDVTALLLAADVLVTDYSSLLFDFASTRKPIVLFTPDLETYRDEIRGLSLDLEAVAPGPLLRTTAEVAEALRDTESLAATYRERYERFVESYCSLSDGQAASRVVERVFRS
jgi:CDP-glycerol glycerophosphotransferase